MMERSIMTQNASYNKTMYWKIGDKIMEVREKVIIKIYETIKIKNKNSKVLEMFDVNTSL